MNGFISCVFTVACGRTGFDQMPTSEQGDAPDAAPSTVDANHSAVDANRSAVDAASVSTETVSLMPLVSVFNFSTIGVPNDSALADNVIDGTSFEDSDDELSYVRTDRRVVITQHRLSYQAGQAIPTTAKSVVVNIKIRAFESQGEFWIRLHDAQSEIGASPVTAIGPGMEWHEFSFVMPVADASIFDGSQLQTELFMNNMTSVGTLQYTTMWIDLHY